MPSAADPAPDLEEIIEIRDPTIDVRGVMAQIRKTLQERGPIAAPAAVAAGVPAVDPDLLAYYLSEAHLSGDQVWVEMDVQSPRLPVLGGWLERVKRTAHELVVYYVNKHAALQVQFNISITQALSALAARQSELDGLRAEVADLKSRLDRLEPRQ